MFVLTPNKRNGMGCTGTSVGVLVYIKVAIKIYYVQVLRKDILLSFT